MASSILPSVLPTNQLASYQRPAVAAQPAAPSASSQVGQYATHQLGALMRASQGQSISPSAQVSVASAPKANTAVGANLQNTQAHIKQAADRSRQLYQLVAERKKAQAQGGSVGLPGGRNPGAGGFGQLQNPAGLTRVGSGYLATPAAQALAKLNAAYHAATGMTITLTEGWRSLDRQQQLYALYRAGKGNLAAAPGHSVHGTGRAADLGGIGGMGTASFNWLVNNGSKFGWSWTGRNFSQVEPWHWEYIGG